MIGTPQINFYGYWLRQNPGIFAIKVESSPVRVRCIGSAVQSKRASASKGYTEEDAILQARMAHILRASSYNFKTKKIRLWRPFWLDD